MSRPKGIADIPRTFFLSEPVRPKFLECRRQACRQPYRDHPRGCPKYGHHPDCPPQAPRFDDLYEGQVRVVACRFDFAAFLRWRRSLRPDWTERALRNPRHWQKHLAAALDRHLDGLRLEPNEEVVLNPEAQGIDVDATCGAAGLELQWPPRDVVCRVAMIARRRR